MKVGDPGKIAELHAGLAFQEANLKNVPSLHREERAILAGEMARTKNSIARDRIRKLSNDNCNRIRTPGRREGYSGDR